MIISKKDIEFERVDLVDSFLGVDPIEAWLGEWLLATGSSEEEAMELAIGELQDWGATVED